MFQVISATQNISGGVLYLTLLLVTASNLIKNTIPGRSLSLVMSFYEIETNTMQTHDL